MVWACMYVHLCTPRYIYVYGSIEQGGMSYGNGLIVVCVCALICMQEFRIQLDS